MSSSRWLIGLLLLVVAVPSAAAELNNLLPERARTDGTLEKLMEESAIQSSSVPLLPPSTGVLPPAVSSAATAVEKVAIPVLEDAAPPVDIEAIPVEAKPEPVRPAIQCGDLQTIASRVECRLRQGDFELSPTVSAIEVCRWGSDDWRQSCTQRFELLAPCFDAEVSAERINCIKLKLGLPAVLTDITTQCYGDLACEQQYRDSIYHLVALRLFDLQRRAELWYIDGRLSLDDTRNFVVHAIEAQWQFFAARSASVRLDILDRMQLHWFDLMEKLDS